VVVELNGIYVELPRKTWVKVKGRLGGIATSKKVGQTLIAESLDGKPEIKKKPIDTYYISSTSVTKYIYKLIDSNLHRTSLIVIRYIDVEKYRVEIYSGRVKEIRKIAEEMNIIRKQKPKNKQ